MILKVHELKKALSRFYNRQPFKCYLLNDDGYVYLCQITDEIKFSYLVEIVENDSEEKIEIELDSDSLMKLNEYFKSVRVRRNCSLKFENGILQIAIQDKDKKYTQTFEIAAKNAEGIQKSLVMLNENSIKDMFHVKKLFVFTKVVSNSLQTDFIPASQNAQVYINNNAATLVYGYHDTVAKVNIPCKCEDTNVDTAVSYDYLINVRDFLKETLAQKAALSFKNGHITLATESFVLSSPLNENVLKIDYRPLFEKILDGASDTRMMDNEIFENLNKINKEKMVNLEKSVMEINGVSLRIPNISLRIPIDKIFVYFSQDSNAWNFIFNDAEIKDIYPKGKYINAKLLRKFSEYENVEYKTTSSGALYIRCCDGEYLLLPSVI